MEINGTHQKQLCEALLSAFPTRQDLDMMVFYGLNEHLAAITEGSNLEHTVFELVQWSKARGRLEELVTGAFKQNSHNIQLLSIAKQLGLRNDQHVTQSFGTDKNVLHSATYSSATPTIDFKNFEAEIDLLAKLTEDLPTIVESDPRSFEHTHAHDGREETTIGPALRALYSFLKEKDKAQFWAGLQKIITPDGNILWLCEQHARPYESPILQIDG